MHGLSHQLLLPPADEQRPNPPVHATSKHGPTAKLVFSLLSVCLLNPYTKPQWDRASATDLRTGRSACPTHTSYLHNYALPNNPCQQMHHPVCNVLNRLDASGATQQTGDHSTGGSVQTLKWCKYDAEERVATLSVFGGAGGARRGETGLWTEPVSCIWAVFMNIGRLCDYTYRFEFSEDYKEIDLRVMVNCCCVCPVCLPCCSAWCTVPKCITKTTAEVKEGACIHSTVHYLDIESSSAPY